VYLQNPSVDNQYLHASGTAGAGYGVSTTSTNSALQNGSPVTQWTIFKSSGSGVISSGDEIYLRNPSHDNHYLEAHSYAGDGYGVSTRSTNTSLYNNHPVSKWTIYSWSGQSGAISSGDQVYLRNPSHDNQYLETHGGNAVDGYGVSTTADRNQQPTGNGYASAQWTIVSAMC
jgi:hypothetical protein